MTNDDPKGSFIRWQSIRIAQLTYAVNLILGLSVAALGFQLSILFNEGYIPVSWQKCAYSVSLILLLLAVGFGIWCVVNRLRSFRATAKVARMREKGCSEEEMQPHRALYKKLDEKTWVLFWWQIGTFGIGVLLLVVAIMAILSQKLL